MRLSQLITALKCVPVLGVLAKQSTGSSSSPKTNMMYSTETDTFLLSTRNRKIKNISEAREASKHGLPLGRTGY